MFRCVIIIGALIAGTNLACADQIEGTWKRPNGVIVLFKACGPDFCASPTTTKYAGQPAGKLSSSGKRHYTGTLIDLQDNSTYKGKAAIHDQVLTLKGCIFAGWICKSEDWVRQ